MIMSNHVRHKPRHEKAGDEKYWLENGQTGDRGFLVDASDMDHPVPVMPPTAEGIKLMVQLDRPSEIRLKKYDPGKWNPVATAHPLSDLAKADIAHAALRRLAFFLGDHPYSRREIISFKEGERIAFIRRGPKGVIQDIRDDDVRAQLWSAIRDVLEGKGHRPTKK